MQTDYIGVMDAALSLRDIGADPSRRDIEERYDAELCTLVDHLLAEHSNANRAKDAMVRDFDAISSASDEQLAAVYDRVRYDIANRIDDVAGPTAAQQATRTRLVGLAGVVAVLLFAAGYGGLRQYSATPVKDPIETKAGLQQRANALAKVIRYESWSSSGGRGNGIVKNILLWPIEPTEVEIQNAGEFAGLILSGARQLGEEHLACNVPAGNGATLSEPEIDLIGAVTEHLRAPTAKWRDPPFLTILDPIRLKHPC